MIQIDGSYGEGGGQIIRTSLSLSALTGQPMEMVNIRARRTKPGLQPQHLTAVRAAARLCSAVLQGDAVGSTRVVFQPSHPPHPQPYRFEIGTAGAAALVIQTVLIPLAHAAGPSSVEVRGGTHVPHSPPADYVEDIYIPALRRAGLDLQFRMTGAGFFPRGGGELSLQVKPGAPVQPLNFEERGKLKSIQAYITTSGLPEHVAQRGKMAVEKAMKSIGRPVEAVARELPSPGPGAAVTLAVECEGGFAGFSAVGERGKPIEAVAEEACAGFLPWWKSGAACDEHLADQLVLPMALAEGESRWTAPAVTDHLRTVLWVTGLFLPIEAAMEERPDGSALVSMQGAGRSLPS